MRAEIGFLILLTILITSISAPRAMPDSFYQAMSNVRAENTICVRNYDAGAGVIESYRDFQHLEKETRSSAGPIIPPGMRAIPREAMPHLRSG